VYEAPRQRPRAAVTTNMWSKAIWRQIVLPIGQGSTKYLWLEWLTVAGELTNPRTYGSIRRPCRNARVRLSAVGVV